jgi:hypothetical protein
VCRYSRTREKELTYWPRPSSTGSFGRFPQLWCVARDRARGPETDTVHHTEPLPSAAVAWAERQSGVLTRAQLISFGLHDSQVARLVRQQVLIFELLAHRAWNPSPSSSLAEERTPPLVPPPCGGARFPTLAARDRAVIGFLTLSVPRLTNSRRLARALERRTRIAHRRLIAETAIGVQSPLEFRWIKEVERPHRLPIPTRPYRLPSGAVTDGAYEEFRVLLELDGRRYHDGERRFRDWGRDNLSSEDGWLTLRYGWRDTVVESCETAGNLVRVLRRRGYDGELARCTHCRH